MPPECESAYEQGGDDSRNEMMLSRHRITSIRVQDSGLRDVADAGVVRRSRTGSRPEELAVTFGYGNVVDTGFPPTHQAVVVEFPELVAITAEPLARRVVAFVLKAHRDAALVEGPKYLHEPVVQFPLPFPGQELLDLAATAQEVIAVSPDFKKGTERINLLGEPSEMQTQA